MTTKIVKITPDEGNESPCEWGRYKLYSFCKKHASFSDPTECMLKYADHLKDGFAFLLSYYEHGDCIWNLMDENSKNNWDFTKLAGILIIENLNEKSLTGNHKAAASFLESYTKWCNGEIYHVEVLEQCFACGNHIDAAVDSSCGGFYDEESIVDFLKEKDVDLSDCEVVGSCDFVIEKSVEAARKKAKEKAAIDAKKSLDDLLLEHVKS